MSRIGKLPVMIPSGVTVKVEDRIFEATGPKGTLSLQLTQHINLVQDGEQLLISKADNSMTAQEQWGLTRTLVANLVQGVHEGFKKQLDIQGVGYRVALSGNILNLSLGYSHTIDFKLPEGITAEVDGNVISLDGASKQLVGQTAAQIRALRKPEPYKGKGIRYVGEQVRRKAGKTAAAKGATA